MCGIHQGLAHYLEHMLFMGSTKYPDENEYDSFISASGGSTNAFTECEYTLYHFDVLPRHLEKVRRRSISISISGGSFGILLLLSPAVEMRLTAACLQTRNTAVSRQDD